ncbi:TrmJ/YjtD family RNA methyltransferase [Pantanalinema rosaneae CENA516]|uniref:RNA methyltransferase n=1 Tax=Pantanalinema rosaneae TaxID=1620701 RepID=UPI003D6F12AE
MPDPRLANIRIVLVEPAGALNVGSIARIMKNMGLNHLVLVNPQCDPVGAEARQMAVHAPEILETALIVATLPEALKGCQRAIATTGLLRPLATPLEAPRTALPWLLSDEIQSDSAALIFGREDRGLTNEELNYAHRLIYIPSSPVYPSLNLAQAVAICCYELFLLTDGGDGGDGGDGRSHWQMMGEMVVSPRQAWGAATEVVEVAQAIDLISAELVCPYPPGIPVLMPGERITKAAIGYLQHVLASGGMISGCADPDLKTLKVITR